MLPAGRRLASSCHDVDPMMPTDELYDDTAAATRHVYPASAMVGDYLRAAAVVVPVGAVFASVPVGTVPAVVLGSFAALFGIFGLRTVLRHGTSLEMTDTELRAEGAWRRRIPWAELDRLKLAYYSTSRDRRSGWMQLEIGAGRTRVKLDSRIDGFDRLVRRAAEVADARGVALDDATAANLQALGIRLPEPGAWR
jgi:hypothetical protein